MLAPPFLTDDPEPVDYKHWEVYFASFFNNDRSGYIGSAPHVEINYGVVPNVQLHIIAPLTYSRAVLGALHYGYGDTELGVKWRFAQEGAHKPMVGIFPLIEVPTGDTERGLGSGQTTIFLPLWIQKSWGPWTTYGGGGYWYNPGPGNHDYGFLGWLLQKSVTRQLTIGTELFYDTAATVGAPTRTSVNVGLIYDFDEGHHLLFSAGDDIHGTGRGQSYVAYQWTFGPHEPAKPEDAPTVKKAPPHER